MTPVHGHSPSMLKANLLSALMLGVSFAFVGVVAVAVFSGDKAFGPNDIDVAAYDVATAKTRHANEPGGARLRLSIPQRNTPEGLLANDTAADAEALKTALPAVTQASKAAPNVASVQEEFSAKDVLPGPGDMRKVAIIIDDMGHSPRHSDAALKLPRQIAFALLPYARATPSFATRARLRGHELIVHVPMQPKNDARNPGPYVLKTVATPDELRRKIAWNLDQFEGFYAVNNHMGSAFTEDEASMQILFEELSARGLAFYDSRTTAESKSVELALRYGVSMAERDVFLDNDIKAGAVDKQLERLELLARRNGSAIAIGHPHRVTFEQIAQWAQTLKSRNIMLVPPSVILKDRRTPKWRTLVRAAGQSKLAQTSF